MRSLDADESIIESGDVICANEPIFRPHQGDPRLIRLLGQVVATGFEDTLIASYRSGVLPNAGLLLRQRCAHQFLPDARRRYLQR